MANQQIACAETCEQFGRSQQNVLSNSTLCPNGLTNDAQQVLAADLKFCQGGNASTTTTPTPNGACVKGSDNEDACGWGNSTMQLCAYCDGNKDACCGTFDLKAVCGIESSAKPGGTDSSSGSGNSGSGSSSKKLGGGAIAGIVIGVLAGLLIVSCCVVFCANCSLVYSCGSSASETSVPRRTGRCSCLHTRSLELSQVLRLLAATVRTLLRPCLRLLLLPTMRRMPVTALSALELVPGLLQSLVLEPLTLALDSVQVQELLQVPEPPLQELLPWLTTTVHLHLLLLPRMARVPLLQAPTLL